MTAERHIVVLGGGHAGAQAVASLREEGFDGRVTLVGNEDHAPYHRPPLSKAFLKEGGAPPFIRAEAYYGENDIDLKLGAHVSAIDRHGRALVFDDDSTLGFDGLLLATGARVRVPEVPGTDLDGIMYLRSLRDSDELRDRVLAAESIVVVGGGFIGLEVAATAASLDRKVTVLEIAPRLMGRAVAPEISAYFLDAHRKAGIDVRLETGCAAFRGEDGKVAAVETSTGEQLPADLVVVGIGVILNTDLAETADLAIDNGIVVDDHMMTDDPHIAAAGDGVSYDHWHAGRRVRLESVQNAHDQARTAVRGLLGRREPYRDVPWFWSDQGPDKLQMVGLAFGADQRVLRGAPGENRFSVFHYKNGDLIAIDSVNRPADHVLGRHMLKEGFSPAPAMAADESVNLKALFKDWQKEVA